MNAPPSLDCGQRPLFDEQLRVPRIHAIHLLVWLGLAIALVALDSTISAMEMQALRKAVGISVLIPWWTHLARVFVVTAFAACLVGSGVLVRSRCFRMLNRLQPGHWLVLLLALGGILACIAVPIEFVAVKVSPSQGSQLWVFMVVVVLSGLLVEGTSYGFAVFRLRDATRWRVLLAFALANVLLGRILSAPMGMSGTLFGSGVSRWLGPCWWTLLIFVAAAVVAIDLRCRIARDWLHWLGVSLWTLDSVSKLLLAIVALVSAQPGLLDASGVQVRLGGPPNGPPYERIGWEPGDCFTDRGVISLCNAIEKRDLQEIERVVKSGVNVNAKGRGNMTPLLWAFPMGEQVFAKVLELGGNPNVKLTETRITAFFVKGRSVMSLAVVPDPVVYAWGDISTDNHLKLALEHGGDPNIEDLNGDTPIFYLRGDPNKLQARIRLLIDAGADINHRNQQGLTPLISWYCSMHEDAVLYLLEAGADYRIADNHGLDFVLYLADSIEHYQKNGDRRAKSEIAKLQPTIDWLTNEGVNWDAARVALETELKAARNASIAKSGTREEKRAILNSGKTQGRLENIPADYEHRPWLPQRPSLQKPDASDGKRQ